MILDTNALSALIDGDEAIRAVLEHQSLCAIPVIVLGEYRYGIATSRYRQRYEGWLQAHLVDFTILQVTESTTLSYAQIRLDLKKRGRAIPANDAWIAALALQHALPVLSRDAHFDEIATVRRVSW